jgi:hydrogenase small subunit
MLSRRKFLKLCLQGAACASLSQLLLPELAEALRLLPGGKPPVIWIEGTSCTGNFISLDNSADPSLREVLEKIIDLRYNQFFMWPQGQEALDILFSTAEEYRDSYILVVEGGIPLGLPESVVVGETGGEPLPASRLIPKLAAGARAVLAVGNCAAFGGPSGAHPNPTGTRGVWNVVTARPVINVPGCPAHPDWMVGTLVHTILYGLPRVDEFRRPTMFFGELVHDRCPRRFHYFNGDFAAAPGEAGCLLKVGCKGPITHADCPTRKFNDGVNWCINANNPCIGCAAPDFPDGGTSPFFARLTDIRVPPGIETTTLTVTKAVAAVTVAGIGTHFAASLASGRFGKNLSLETEGEKLRRSNPLDLIRRLFRRKIR